MEKARAGWRAADSFPRWVSKSCVRRTPCRSAVGIAAELATPFYAISLRRPHPLQRLVRRPSEIEEEDGGSTHRQNRRGRQAPLPTSPGSKNAGSAEDQDEDGGSDVAGTCTQGDATEGSASAMHLCQCGPHATDGPHSWDEKVQALKKRGEENLCNSCLRHRCWSVERLADKRRGRRQVGVSMLLLKSLRRHRPLHRHVSRLTNRR